MSRAVADAGIIRSGRCQEAQQLLLTQVRNHHQSHQRGVQNHQTVQVGFWAHQGSERFLELAARRAPPILRVAERLSQAHRQNGFETRTISCLHDLERKMPASRNRTGLLGAPLVRITASTRAGGRETMPPTSALGYLPLAERPVNIRGGHGGCGTEWASNRTGRGRVCLAAPVTQPPVSGAAAALIQPRVSQAACGGHQPATCLQTYIHTHRYISGVLYALLRRVSMRENALLPHYPYPPPPYMYTRSPESYYDVFFISSE